jgi:hypothetical protein
LKDSVAAAYTQSGTVHEKQPLAAASHVARPSTVQSSLYRNGTANGNSRSQRASRTSNGSRPYPELQPGDVAL